MFKIVFLTVKNPQFSKENINHHKYNTSPCHEGKSSINHIYLKNSSIFALRRNSALISVPNWKTRSNLVYLPQFQIHLWDYWYLFTRKISSDPPPHRAWLLILFSLKGLVNQVIIDREPRRCFILSKILRVDLIPCSRQESLRFPHEWHLSKIVYHRILLSFLKLGLVNHVASKPFHWILIESILWLDLSVSLNYLTRFELQTVDVKLKP